jgi:hypothetical protein
MVSPLNKVAGFVEGGVKLVNNTNKGIKALKTFQTLNASELETFFRQITRPTPEIIDSFKKSGNPLLELTADALEREAEAVGNNFSKVGALATVFEELPGPLGGFLRVARERAKNLNAVIGDKVQETVQTLKTEAEVAAQESAQATKAAKLLGLKGNPPKPPVQLDPTKTYLESVLSVILGKNGEGGSRVFKDFPSETNGVETNPQTASSVLENVNRSLKTGILQNLVEELEKLGMPTGLQITNQGEILRPNPQATLRAAIKGVTDTFETESKDLTTGLEGTAGAYLNGPPTPQIQTAVDALKQALEEEDFSIKSKDIETFQKLKTGLGTVTNNGGVVELAKQLEDLLLPKQ